MICQKCKDSHYRPRVFVLYRPVAYSANFEVSTPGPEFRCVHDLTEAQLVDVLTPAALFVINHLMKAYGIGRGTAGAEHLRAALIHRSGASYAADDQLEEVRKLLNGQD